MNVQRRPLAQQLPVVWTVSSERPVTTHTMMLNSVLIVLLLLRPTCEDMLSRRRRYVVFPESSTFSVAVCAQLRALTEDLRIYTFSMNWAVAYELPNNTLRDLKTRRPFLRRRHRRELYRKLEVAFNSATLDGRMCILRTLCEASQKLIPRANLGQEILRTLFIVPYEMEDDDDDSENEVADYDTAHQSGVSGKNCVQLYPNCNASILDMVLGGFLDE